MRRLALLTSLTLLSLCLAACAPKVGTERWCEKMDDTPNGDWSVNDAKAYAEYCLFGNYIDKDE
ncbi:MAG: DUF3012 domain-containing protein [Woeseiaceae bacterium]|nr:DUF3012 domain-containing protein [Woeseiaceae bacterium]NIP19955.1 DUF3012 domain-containing protein [Woeseiaceae bacterium]NIS88751.1 DUF3012 domain-containing protein [Woeseiaceae bacterium]